MALNKRLEGRDNNVMEKYYFGNGVVFYVFFSCIASTSSQIYVHSTGGDEQAREWARLEERESRLWSIENRIGLGVRKEKTRVVIKHSEGKQK